MSEFLRISWTAASMADLLLLGILGRLMIERTR